MDRQAVREQVRAQIAALRTARDAAGDAAERAAAEEAIEKLDTMLDGLVVAAGDEFAGQVDAALADLEAVRTRHNLDAASALGRTILRARDMIRGAG